MMVMRQSEKCVIVSLSSYLLKKIEMKKRSKYKEYCISKQRILGAKYKILGMILRPR